ncbi:MAG: hypothetical protein KAR21_23810, partial [Spirochaetales bacterium]|nr:hypothetical protein [Spirochaetales bacterium]
LGVKPEDVPDRSEYSDFAEFLLDVFKFDVKKCPKCKGKLVFKNGEIFHYKSLKWYIMKGRKLRLK